jgi:hypothetical protein
MELSCDAPATSRAVLQLLTQSISLPSSPSPIVPFALPQSSPGLPAITNASFASICRFLCCCGHPYQYRLIWTEPVAVGQFLHQFERAFLSFP